VNYQVGGTFILSALISCHELLFGINKNFSGFETKVAKSNPEMMICAIKQQKS
jgi:hypothetical protein